MISYIKIQNFKSIVNDYIYFDHDGKEKNQKDGEVFYYLESKTKHKKKLVPVMMFLGKNESGKRNILDAILNLKLIILDSSNAKFTPNKLFNIKKTVLKANFIINKNKYKVHIEYNNEFVTKIIHKNGKIIDNDEEFIDYIKNKLIFKNEESKIETYDIEKSEVVKLMKRLDFDISDYKKEDGEFYIYKKNLKNKEVEFKLKEESRGFIKTFRLVFDMLHALKDGKILFIDKLCTCLHPLLFQEIINLFKTKRYNKNNTQLIFTSNSLDTISRNFFLKSEVCIVDKIHNSKYEKGTFFDKISDFEGNEGDKGMRIDYLTGVFGSTPFSI